jgi:hypothetical protein
MLKHWSSLRLAAIAGAWVFIVATYVWWERRTQGSGPWTLKDAEGNVLLSGTQSSESLPMVFLVLAFLPPAILVAIWAFQRRTRHRRREA